MSYLYRTKSRQFTQAYGITSCTRTKSETKTILQGASRPDQNPTTTTVQMSTW